MVAPSKPSGSPAPSPFPDASTAPGQDLAARSPAPRKADKVRLTELAIQSLMRAYHIDPQRPLFDDWPDDVRALPSDWARSALFTTRNKRAARRAMQDEPIYHYDKDVSITYTGVELRADDDQLVWLQILHYAMTSGTPLGQPLQFNLHHLCRDVGWSVNGRNYERLRVCIRRLKANSVQLDNARTLRGVGVSLIEKFTYEGDESNGTRYTVWIDRNLILMFVASNYAYLLWDAYRDLSPTARKLCDYLSSHKDPFPLSLEKFRRGCASDASSASSWTQHVRAACAELQACQLVKRAWVEGERIYIDRR